MRRPSILAMLLTLVSAWPACAQSIGTGQLLRRPDPARPEEALIVDAAEALLAVASTDSLASAWLFDWDDWRGEEAQLQDSVAAAMVLGLHRLQPELARALSATLQAEGTTLPTLPRNGFVWVSDSIPTQAFQPFGVVLNLPRLSTLSNAAAAVSRRHAASPINSIVTRMVIAHELSHGLLRTTPPREPRQPPQAATESMAECEADLLGAALVIGSLILYPAPETMAYLRQLSPPATDANPNDPFDAAYLRAYDSFSRSSSLSYWTYRELFNVGSAYADDLANTSHPRNVERVDCIRESFNLLPAIAGVQLVGDPERLIGIASLPTTRLSAMADPRGAVPPLTLINDVARQIVAAPTGRPSAEPLSVRAQVMGLEGWIDWLVESWQQDPSFVQRLLAESERDAIGFVAQLQALVPGSLVMRPDHLPEAGWVCLVSDRPRRGGSTDTVGSITCFHPFLTAEDYDSLHNRLFAHYSARRAAGGAFTDVTRGFGLARLGEGRMVSFLDNMNYDSAISDAFMLDLTVSFVQQ